MSPQHTGPWCWDGHSLHHRASATDRRDAMTRLLQDCTALDGIVRAATASQNRTLTIARALGYVDAANGITQAGRTRISHAYGGDE